MNMQLPRQGCAECNISPYRLLCIPCKDVHGGHIKNRSYSAPVTWRCPGRNFGVEQCACIDPSMDTVDMKIPLLFSALAALAYMGASFAAAPPAPAQPVMTPPAASESRPPPSTTATNPECSKTSNGVAKKCTDKTLGEEHSSPVMQTAEEKAADQARKKGKDPREAVKKIQEKDYPAKAPN